MISWTFCGAFAEYHLEEELLEPNLLSVELQVHFGWGTTVPLRFLSLPSEAMTTSVIVSGLQLRDTPQELEKSFWGAKHLPTHKFFLHS